MDRHSVVLKTASFAAGFRALDYKQPSESLAQDFLAAPLGGAAFAVELEKVYRDTQEGELWGYDQQGRRVANWFASRSRFLDQELLTSLQGMLPASLGKAPKEDIHAQVLVFGSGLDSRPWRLSLPDHIAWFEVDWPECIDGKKARLASIGAATARGQQDTKYPLRPAAWQAVATDLADPGFVSDLQAAGFDKTLPSVFLCEGLLYYLTHDQVDTFLKALAGLGPTGSTVLADAHDKVWFAHNRQQVRAYYVERMEMTQQTVDTLVSWLPFDCTDALAEVGWTLEAVTNARGWAKACGSSPAGDVALQRLKGKQTEDFSAWVRRHWFILKAALY